MDLERIEISSSHLPVRPSAAAAATAPGGLVVNWLEPLFHLTVR